MNRKILVLLCIFILSRLFFANSSPVFFDSPEYLNRFLNPNFFQTITSGHSPFHLSYIMLFWSIFQTANFLRINAPFAIIFMQILFSAITVYCFYRFVEIITNAKIAIIAVIICALTPLYWITNVSIMVESTYINFFFISIFLISLSITKNAHSKFYLFAGCIFFGLAILTNPLVILWIPFILSVVYFLKKRKMYLILLLIILSAIFAFLINSFFIASAFHMSLLKGINQYLFGVDIKLTPNISSFITALRFIRNTLFSILIVNTSIIFILSIASLITMFKRKMKLFIISLLWTFPIIITSQWYDSLLFARHGTIAGFGFALLVAIFLEKRKILYFMVIGYLLLVSLPTLALLKQPIPYLQMRKFVKTLPKGLLIETHFARPQIEGYYSGKTIFINQPGWNKQGLEKTIDIYLQNKKPIFITSQALSDPYGIYSGPFLNPLSLSYSKKLELEDILPLYSTIKYSTIDEDAGLLVYEIISKEKSKFPNIPNLTYSNHQIGYFDPANQLLLFIESAKIIQSHNIIKE